MDESCIGICFTQLWALSFLSTDVSQRRVKTHLGCGGILNYCFIRNLLLSLPTASERIFESCLAFADLQVKVEWLKHHFLSQSATQ